MALWLPRLWRGLRFGNGRIGWGEGGGEEGVSSIAVGTCGLAVKLTQAGRKKTWQAVAFVSRVRFIFSRVILLRVRFPFLRETQRRFPLWGFRDRCLSTQRENGGRLRDASVRPPRCRILTAREHEVWKGVAIAYS